MALISKCSLGSDEGETTHDGNSKEDAAHLSKKVHNWLNRQLKYHFFSLWQKLEFEGVYVCKCTLCMGGWATCFKASLGSDSATSSGSTDTRAAIERIVQFKCYISRMSHKSLPSNIIYLLGFGKLEKDLCWGNLPQKRAGSKQFSSPNTWNV